MDAIFFQLAAILAIAFVVAYIARAFKQPIIIGYILAGIVVSPFLLHFGATTEVIHTFSQIGIAFLLFIVGLHLNPKVIKEIGTPALIIGVSQIALTFGATFLVASKLLHLSTVSSVYAGIALAFSSTIIIMKLLSDKRQLDSLYGKMSIGILIIQDLVAVLVLMFISSTDGGASIGTLAVKTFLIGGGLVLGLFLFGYFALLRFIQSVARSQELLFLFSICWCFVVAALFSGFGFSIEIGALIAGMVLSLSPYSTEISARIRPIRDFFLIIFFIILGLNIDVSGIGGILVNALIFSSIALILKPIIIMWLMSLFKYTKRSNFLVGSSLGQISEFSLIVLALAATVGHISAEFVATLTLTLVITILGSTYFMIYSNKMYRSLAGVLKVFERNNIKKNRGNLKKSYNAMLFGYNRTGFKILKALSKLKKRYLVVDFNPDTIKNLNKFKVPCVYGDVDDTEFLEELPLEKLELAISTVPDYEVNFLLVESIRLVNSEAIVIARAENIKDALELYEKGANYVLTSNLLGGEHVSDLIQKIKTPKGFESRKNQHMELLENVLNTSKGKLRLNSKKRHK